jgi:hypothetical protein
MAFEFPTGINHSVGGMKPRPTLREPRFPLGQIVMTPGAMETMQRSNQTPLRFLLRHGAGDWGDVDAGDKRLNDQALVEGGRVLSSYQTKLGEKIWVITEADRSSTCLLLPSEY